MRKLKSIECIFLILVFSISLNAQEVTVDLTNLKQPISGFGGAHYPEWGSGLTDDQVEKIFGNNPWQIGLQILRLPVPTDTSIFSMEVPAAAKAKSTGAILFSTPWSPPPSMKTNKNVIKGKLDTAFYDDFAHYLDSFGKYMASKNAALYAISIQNEPDYLPTYASCEYNAKDFIKFLSEQGSKITGVKIIAPESFQFRHVLSDSILNDSAAASNVNIIGGHIYGGGIQDYPLARQKGKEVWMTEYYVGNTSWTGDIETAKLIHDCMIVNYNGFVYWTIKNQTGFLNDAGDILKRGYIIGQFSKFVRRGFTRVEATTTALTNVDVTAYKKDTNLVIVAINRNSSPVSLSFKLNNGSAYKFTQFTTSQTKNLKNEGDFLTSAGAFTVTLDAQSVSTFTTLAESGSRKTNAAPLANAGIDKSYVDSNGDGSEAITLDASASSDPDGTIADYTWSEAGKQLANGINPTFSLGTGIHNIALTITDSDGAITRDSVKVTINLPEGSNEAHLWFEAECGTVGSMWNITQNSAASNGYFIVVKPGNNSTASASENVSSHVIIEFDAPESGNYKVWARMRVPTADDDSYWVKMDSGSWVMWNNISGGAAFAWDYVKNSTNNSYALAKGKHILTFAYREDGAELDKFYITNTGTVPTALGDTAANTCTITKPGNNSLVSQKINNLANMAIYPNPVSSYATIEFFLTNNEIVTVSIVDLTGRTVSTLFKGLKNRGINSVQFENNKFENGIYLCRISNGKQVISKQLMIMK